MDNSSYKSDETLYFLNAFRNWLKTTEGERAVSEQDPALTSLELSKALMRTFKERHQVGSSRT